MTARQEGRAAKAEAAAAAIVGVLTAAIANWWLIFVASRLGVKPEVGEVNKVDSAKFWGAVIVTIVTAVIAIWWLIAVFQRIGVEPKVESGVVVLDTYARAKDILLVVLPLFSAAVAYWVGAEGTAAAKEQAKRAQAQLLAVLDVSPPDSLMSAKGKYPGAFPELRP